MQSVLAPKGILVNLVEFSPLSGGIAACIQAAAAAKPLGMLIAGEPSLPPEALPAELPVVLLGSYDRLENCNICGIHYRDAAEKMVSHLHTMGHRSIWLLQSSGESPEKAAITAGYRQAAAALAAAAFAAGDFAAAAIAASGTSPILDPEAAMAAIPDLCQDFGHGIERNHAAIGIASGLGSGRSKKASLGSVRSKKSAMASAGTL